MRFGPGGDLWQYLTKRQIDDLSDAANAVLKLDYPFDYWYPCLHVAGNPSISFHCQTTMAKIQKGLFMYAAAKMYRFGRLEDLWNLLLSLINQEQPFHMIFVPKDFDQRNSSSIRLVYVFLNILCWTPQSTKFVTTVIGQLINGPFYPDSQHDGVHLLKIEDAAEFNMGLWEALQKPIAEYLKGTGFLHDRNTGAWSSRVLG